MGRDYIEEEYRDRNEGTRKGLTGVGEKEITAGSDRVVEINVARLIGATEECACGLSGSQLAYIARTSYISVSDTLDDNQRGT